MIYDISLSISNDTIIWPGDPKVKLSLKNSLTNGDACNVTNLEMGVHTATHIDAPYHFIESGNTVDEILLESLLGKVYVIELQSKNLISLADIKKYDFSEHNKVILKTKNSTYLQSANFNKDFIGLSLEAAKHLVANNIELIGIDYLSIESFHSNGLVHKELLKNNTILLEGLNLTEIKEGIYELICLPLKLIGSDGAPARAILKDYKNK